MIETKTACNHSHTLWAALTHVSFKLSVAIDCFIALKRLLAYWHVLSLNFLQPKDTNWCLWIVSPLQRPTSRSEARKPVVICGAPSITHTHSFAAGRNRSGCSLLQCHPHCITLSTHSPRTIVTRLHGPERHGSGPSVRSIKHKLHRVHRGAVFAKMFQELC